jgi:predicted  nucleic acid-binding Zn-ribbon protein
MSETPKPLNKADRNKIIFLTIAIVSLLGSNAYLYFKDKHENERYVTANTEKDRLKLEVEKVEVELDKINSVNLKVNGKLLKEQGLARQQIAELKSELQKGQLTKGELVSASKKISELKEYVYNYNQEITRLAKENSNLKSERDSLVRSVKTINDKATLLEQTNADLNAKVVTGAALKAANIEVQAFKIKHSGKNIKVSHAGAAKKLAVRFNVVSNQLAKKDYHQVYLRVFDPAGNLIANANDMFEAEGEEMQYTEMITISYNDDETQYQMEWLNPAEFIKGTYSIILYADGYVMGKSMITLK